MGRWGLASLSPVMSCGDLKYYQISNLFTLVYFPSALGYVSSHVALVCMLHVLVCVHFWYDLACNQFLLQQIGLLSQLFFHCSR